MTDRVELTLFSIGLLNNLSQQGETLHCSEGFISAGFEQDLADRPLDKAAEGKKSRKKDKRMYETG